MTGDEIRGSGRIIGGAIFGGAAGAGGSLVNVVVKEETGKDIPDMALGMVTNGMGSKTTATGLDPNSPHARLNEAIAAYSKAEREEISQVNF